MKNIIAFFENGDEISTPINGTDQEVREYYLNNSFNLGRVEDNVQKCIEVLMLPEDTAERIHFNALNHNRKEVVKNGFSRMHHAAINQAKEINAIFPTKVMPINDHLLKRVEDLEINGYKIHFNTHNNLFSVDNGITGPEYFDTQDEARETAEKG